MTVDVNGNPVGWDDYYPYGMQMTGRSYTSSADQRYKFTGKERDASTGLDYFGKRYYDSFRGQWLQVDPMDSKYPSWSSYTYCVDNPGRFIDPNGADLGWYQDGSGQNKYNADVHSQADMDKIGLKGKYISEQFQEVDTKTNLEVSYNIDGTKQYGIMPLMNTVVSSGKDGTGGIKIISTINSTISAMGASEKVMEGVLRLDKGVEVAAPVFSKTLGYFGQTLGYVSAASSTYNFIQHPSWSTGTEAVVDVGLALSKSVNPWIAAGVGVMEATGLEENVLKSVYGEK